MKWILISLTINNWNPIPFRTWEECIKHLQKLEIMMQEAAPLSNPVFRCVESVI